MNDDQTKRKDAGKPLYHLLPPEFLQDYAEIALGRDPVASQADSQTKQGFAAELLGLLTFWRGGDQSTLYLPCTLEEIEAVCAVLAMGAQKYAPNLWEKSPMTYSRVYRSAISHALKHIANENGGLDSESGLPHLHHFRGNVLFLWTYHTRGLTHLDDRPTGVHRANLVEPAVACYDRPVITAGPEAQKDEVVAGGEYRLVSPDPRDAYNEMWNVAGRSFRVVTISDTPDSLACYFINFDDSGSLGQYVLGSRAVLERVS